MRRDARQVLSSRFTSTRPDCFDSEVQYRDYMTLKRMSQVVLHKHPGVCMDCTPEYKAKMLEQGRCQHPETLFVVQVDRHMESSLVGINMDAPWYRKAVKGQTVFHLLKEEELDHQQSSEREVGREGAAQQDQGTLARAGAQPQPRANAQWWA